MSFDFAVSDIIPATPQQIYDAWLDSRGHAQMTGGGKALQSAKEGAVVTAWDGYISGRNLTLEPGSAASCNPGAPPVSPRTTRIRRSR